MQSLHSVLQNYQAYHTKKVTKITHFVGVPLVILGLMIFLGWFFVGIKPFFEISVLWIVVVITTIYYARLDLQLGLITDAGLVILAIIASSITEQGLTKTSFFSFLFCFVIGWIIQFVGHFFEKRKPALLDNLWQALAAPIFLVAEAAVMLGYRKDLV